LEDTISELLEESIGIELNAGRLYRLYSEMFPADRDFWVRLSMEEMNHAALLKSARNFLRLGKLPMASIYPNLEVLKGLNQLISSRMDEYQTNKPGMLDAYRFALELETSAAEEHFQEIMGSHQEDKVLEIFRKLSGGDKDHAERILALIADTSDR